MAGAESLVAVPVPADCVCQNQIHRADDSHPPSFRFKRPLKECGAGSVVLKRGANGKLVCEYAPPGAAFDEWCQYEEDSRGGFGSPRKVPQKARISCPSKVPQCDKKYIENDPVVSLDPEFASPSLAQQIAAYGNDFDCTCPASGVTFTCTAGIGENADKRCRKSSQPSERVGGIKKATLAVDGGGGGCYLTVYSDMNVLCTGACVREERRTTTGKGTRAGMAEVDAVDGLGEQDRLDLIEAQDFEVAQ